jgi:hypothetical protein
MRLPGLFRGSGGASHALSTTTRYRWSLPGAIPSEARNLETPLIGPQISRTARNDSNDRNLIVVLEHVQKVPRVSLRHSGKSRNPRFCAAFWTPVFTVVTAETTCHHAFLDTLLLGHITRGIHAQSAELKKKQKKSEFGDLLSNPSP